VRMKYMEMLKGARNIVTVCANVQEGEDVLIVTDTTRVSLAEVLAIAVN
jgi:leucyl aminopeptidase (aminopeptidase T)